MRYTPVFFVLITMLATTASAGRISYSAMVGCNDTCVTAYVQWQSEPFPVSFVEVDDNLGGYLFGLNTPFPPQTTGSIVPDPQTISGLSPDVIALISSGLSTVGGAFSTSFASVRPLGTAQVPRFANLNLLDSNRNVIDSVVFTVNAAPEPAVWSLYGAGLGVMLVWGRFRRRKFQGAD